MKLLFSSLFIMLACGLVLSCCKNAETPGPAEEQLPPITSTGAGTFGCKVNGKVWVAKSNKTGWPPTYASINKQVHNETNISGSIINGNTDFVVINVLFKEVNKTDFIIGLITIMILKGNIMTFTIIYFGEQTLLEEERLPCHALIP